MKKGIGLLIGSVCALAAVAVEPLYSKHDYIKGGVEILTNVEEWVSGELSVVSGEIQVINQKIENIPSDDRLNAVAQSATNYTDEVKQELQTQISTLVPDKAGYADEAGGLKAETETRAATTIFQKLDESVNATDVQQAIDSVDTSYTRTIGITNINQTVQYVFIEDAEPPPLVIQTPESGETKDWVVYVYAQTNVTIKLPPAKYWMGNTSITNQISPQTPTMLFFSEVTDGVFSMGRVDAKEVVVTE